MTRPIVDVAVGVLVQPDGCFLLASRPHGKPYAGFWEFPGGKLEPNEPVDHALHRELHEELGIDIGEALPWVVREFEYPHAHVRLHFRRVFGWRGALQAREGQSLRFCTLDDLPPGPLLPATVPVMRWLALPPIYALTNAAELGVDVFRQRLARRLAGGLRLIQFREPSLDVRAADELLGEVVAQAHSVRARVLVSSRHPAAWAARADGIHLTARDLMVSRERPAVALAGASVHTRAELARAATLGLDFAVFGPVAPTASHPGSKGLGWTRLAEEIESAPLPVFAIGGLSARALPDAQRAGAHGIASQRALWSDDEPGVQCEPDVAVGGGGVSGPSPSAGPAMP
jgi:8-oxo-dGTP diphosphatase